MAGAASGAALAARAPPPPSGGDGGAAAAPPRSSPTRRIASRRTTKYRSRTAGGLRAAARKATEKLWGEHQDAALSAAEAVQPVGVPIVIFAHKYDCFLQTYPEAEQQKVMCRTLRFFAHQAGAARDAA